MVVLLTVMLLKWNYITIPLGITLHISVELYVGKSIPLTVVV